MKTNLPIPSDWRLLLEQLYRYVRQQLTSPWTKLAVLLLLFIGATREELSFSLSINGGDWLGGRRSVFEEGATPGAFASFADYRTARRNWSERELEQLAYVDHYQDIALKQRDLHGIPASITLAQGLLESGVGKSTLATRNNNHFGLKCFSRSCSKGHCSNHSDDHHKDFFRIFPSPEESYLAHSRLLKKDRYRGLFDLSPTDYRGWARGLSKAGYATDPNYANKLIGLIEGLELHRLDR